MAKKRSFSVYLLKNGINSSNALKTDNALEESPASKLPTGGKIFIADIPEKPPWWKSFWGIQKNLNQMQKGAIVFLPVSTRCFAITFGHTYHNLKNECYEYDFGLKVTLNSVDPKKLKSTDIFEPSVGKRQRIQTPVDSELTYFDFDQDSTIVKALTGKVKEEFKSLFENATGASNLKISSSLEPNALSGLCERLLEIYSRNDYLTTFPGIHNISPIKDPVKLAELNGLLVEGINSRSDKLFLTIPEIIEFGDALHIKYPRSSSTQVYEDLSVDNFIESLGDEVVSLDLIKNRDIALCDEDGKTQKSFSAFRSILFDCNQAQHHYHLCDGSWYSITPSYIASLEAELDPFFRLTSLPIYNHGCEGEYNMAVSSNDPRYICLDMKNISPNLQSVVEPCDLYIVENGLGKLIHIKRSTRSASLSHLFNQGANSIHLIRLVIEAKNKFIQLVTTNIGANNLVDYKGPIDTENFEVVLGIITEKDPNKKSKNLPLFSRVSLSRVIKSIKLMKIKVAVEYISKP